MKVFLKAFQTSNYDVLYLVSSHFVMDIIDILCGLLRRVSGSLSGSEKQAK